MYGPVFLIPALIRMKKLSYYWKSVLPSVVRSSAFLSSYAGVLLIFACTFRQLLGRNMIPFNASVPAFLASFTLLIEAKSRRGELGMYVTAQAAWCTWIKMVSSGWVRPLPLGDVALCAFAMSILLPLQFTEHGRKNAVQSFLSLLLDAKPRGDAPSKDDSHEAILRSASRAAMIGLGLRGLLSIPMCLKAKSIRPLFRKDTLSLPSCFFFLVSIFKYAVKYLRRTSLSQKTRNAIAGELFLLYSAVLTPQGFLQVAASRSTGICA